MIQARGLRNVNSRDHERFLQTWVGEGLAVIEQPVRASADGSQPVQLTALVASPPPDRPAADALSALLNRTHPHLARICESWDADYLRTPEAEVAGCWHAGRTVMLGGICHGGPIWPDLSPSAALEDAWVLSRMMERWEEEPHQGFSEYERYRRPRAERLRAFAAAQFATHTLRAPMARWRRNVSWSMTSRFLPEISMQKLDWLYGYDCIRGFG